MHADKAAESGVAAFQLLHHQAVLDVGHAGAAVAIEVCAVKAKFAHDGDQLARKTLGAEALLDDGDEVVLDKVARSFADEQFVLAEAGVEVDKIEALKFEAHDLPANLLKLLKTCDFNRWGEGQGTGTRD